MKRTLWISALFLSCISAFADNWHPFPFKAAYYGRQTGIGSFQGLTGGVIASNGPLYTGKVVEGIYLDSAYTSSNGTTVRKRSQQYPHKMENWNWDSGSSLYPIVGHTFIETASDNSYVKLHLRTTANIDLELNFMTADVHASGAQFTVETVLGTLDSVFTLNSMYKLSKQFGIIEFEVNGTQLKLIGSGDLQLGWQPFTEWANVPAVGDEYQFKQHQKYEVFAGGPWCPMHTYSLTEREKRVKVLEYPYQGNPTKALYETIESQDGGATGILYTHVGSSPDQLQWYAEVLPPGCTSGGEQFCGYFICDNGLTMAYDWRMYIDAGPHVQFLPCNKLNFTPEYENWSGSIVPFCNPVYLNVSFPVYLNFQNSCSMGVPLPSITITSVQTDQVADEAFVMFPNPASTTVHFSQTTPGQISIADVHGKIWMETTDREINISHLPIGLYVCTIANKDGHVHHQKLVKE